MTYLERAVLVSLAFLLACDSGMELHSRDPSPREEVDSDPLAQKIPGVRACIIQTASGHLVTAVGGGGRLTDAIHTDATSAGDWENFWLVPVPEGSRYGIQTFNDNWLTAVGGGGRASDAVQTTAKLIGDWEKFELVSLGASQYGIRTFDGHYLTAVGGGGRVKDAIHSDATQIGSWERFRLSCRRL